MVGDAPDDKTQIRLGINVIEFCRTDQAIDGSRSFNLYVRRLFCEFAHAASRTTSKFKSKFQALLVRRGYKRAIVAIGHKILCTIFFMRNRPGSAVLLARQ